MDRDNSGINAKDLYIKCDVKPQRTKFILAMPLRKRIWRLLMLIIKGWCYWD